jgi:acyl carrier protein
MVEVAGLADALGLIAQALYADAASVAPDVAIGLDERWDSLAHLRIMLEIESRLGRQLSSDEIAGVGGARDVAALLAPRT